MLVTSLEKMESIVESRNDLSWDGWNVVRHFGKSSFMNVNSCFKNGRWVNKTVYPITESGWNIPDSIGEKNAGLEK